MKNITFLLVEDCLPSALVGPMTIFEQANHYYLEKGQSPFFHLRIVSLEKGIRPMDDQFLADCEMGLEEVEATDLIFIPAVQTTDLPASVEKNKKFLPWMRKMYLERNSEIASICVGAFILAATGLLDGKKCSTHWIAADLFRATYPAVELTPQRVITDYQGIYTSGGAMSFQNLVIYLIEKYCGKEVAVWLSKCLLIDMANTSQLPFTIFNGIHHHRDTAILNAQKLIEKKYAQIKSVEEIADNVSLPKRTFVRRFKNATDFTPIQYLQKVRIEAAKKALESSNETISGITFDVGYNDVKSFRGLFKKYTGLTPIAYRKKFSLALN